MTAEPTRRYKPYPAYRDSGVEWLGEIPAHWEVRRLKTVATVQLSNVDKKSVEGQEAIRLCNYTDVYYNERITADMEFMPATATADQARRFSLHAGDVLITKDSESWTDIAVPAVVAEDMPDVLCGYHLAHIRPSRSCHGPFLARAFSAVGPRDQFQVAANGITRFGLTGDAIATGVCAMPPLTEQRAIAAFLDRETAKIDALVAKKERLIELLQEKRTAVITRAVTKGLDPNVPMKDSGVEWLGDIPAHWEVRRIKYIAEVGNGCTPDRERPEYWGGDYPWLNSSVVNLCEVTQGSDFVTALALAKCHLPRVIPPALLVGITGEGRTRGKATVLRTEATISQHIAFIRPARGRGDVEYLRYVFHSAYTLLREESGAGGSTKAALTCEQLQNMAIPYPPQTEQLAIAAFLDRETAKIDALIAKIREAIERLQEYRTALISAAVTGKIDVREELS